MINMTKVLWFINEDNNALEPGEFANNFVFRSNPGQLNENSRKNYEYPFMNVRQPMVSAVL